MYFRTVLPSLKVQPAATRASLRETVVVNWKMCIRDSDMGKKLPFVTAEQLRELCEQFATPFHLYDERGIRENARLVRKADVYKRQLVARAVRTRSTSWEESRFMSDQYMGAG